MSSIVSILCEGAERYQGINETILNEGVQRIVCRNLQHPKLTSGACIKTHHGLYQNEVGIEEENEECTGEIDALFILL